MPGPNLGALPPETHPAAVIRSLRLFFARLWFALVPSRGRAFASRRQLPAGRYAGSAVEVDTDADWVLIVAEGDYLNHHHGPHTVTREHLEQMLSHYETTSTDLHVDYDHDSIYGGNTRAAGWSTELRLTDRGLEMRAPEFTPAASQAIKDREYRYYSPVYDLETESKAGEAGGAELINVAITSLPYFNQFEIDAIGNSAVGKTDDTPTDDPPFMDRSELIEMLGLAEDATDDQIKAAIKAKKADAETPEGEISSSAVTPEGTLTVEARLAALEAARTEEAQAAEAEGARQKAEALVNSALASFKLLPTQKRAYVNAAVADYDGTKEDLDAIEKDAAKPGGVRVSSKGGAQATKPHGGFASSTARSYVDRALDGDGS